jgi:hypothetical protein
VLGVMFILFGLCGVTSLLFRGGPGSPNVGAIPVYSYAFVLAASLFYFGPAACYLAFASYLANHRRWAVTAMLIVASLNTLLVLVITVGIVITTLAAPRFEWVMAAMIAIFLLFLIALAQMVYYVIRSYAAVKLPPYGREMTSGFTPVFPVPAMPAGNLAPQPPQHSTGA